MHILLGVGKMEYKRYTGRFKVGDQVGIINLKGNMPNVVQAMLKFSNEEAKIILVSLTYYRLDIDNGEWGWEDFMLEPTSPTRTLLRKLKKRLKGD